MSKKLPTDTVRARQRVLWLTDHPGQTVADYERMRAPSPRKAAARREHSWYEAASQHVLQWLDAYCPKCGRAVLPDDKVTA